jgi:hypothetical protein
MNMRRRSVVVLAASALAASALVFGFIRKSEQRPSGPASDLAVPPVGREVVLHVAWHEKSTARIPSGQAGASDTLSGELDLEADLALARERTTDDGDAIRAELRDVRASHVVVSGSELLKTGDDARKALERRPIHFVVEDGRIARVLVDRNAPSLAVQLTENVARQVLLARPKTAGAAFEREEEMPAGTLRVRYEPRGDAYERSILGAVALTGLPDRCDGRCTMHASGKGEVQFDDGNTVARLSEKRQLHAGIDGAPAMFDATASFAAERAKEVDFKSAALDQNELTSKLPGEIFENEADKRASLERLADGATIEDVLGGISGSPAPDTQGPAKGWLVRSSALLELHPELLAEVAVRFEDDELGASGRMAILDLLAATGGNAAKSTLLRVLDSPVARDDQARLTFVQRLMLVEEPNSEMARTLRSRFASSQTAGDAEMAYAEAHVLGAMARRLGARGAHAEAKASVDALATALDKANAPASRAAYLSALGNAGDPSQVSRIAKHARDEDANVRRSVASALRKTNDRASRETLVTLAKDSNEEVQVAAIDSLAHHPIDPTEQHELAQLLDAPNLGGEAEAQLATLLLRQGPPSPAVRGSLEHLLERTEDPRLAARIRLAFEAAESAN